MNQALLQFLGGIGLFLFGMEVMTVSLREIASGSLRRMLARFTETPLKGTITGAAATAVVQSSTAITLTTIGFVGAGLIGFSQALGVLFGANIGTTVTGWIVMLVGFKLKLGLAALPGLFVASLMAVLGNGRTERAGRVLAGLSLLFIGLDMMQGAMVGLEGRLTPDMLPGDGWLGRLALVGIGIVLVTLTQSSSAGTAMILVMLGSGAVNFAQGAAMMIGMNIGTTLTAVVAAIGGGRAMRMTALANLLFNLGTTLLAFPLLDAAAPLLHGTALGRDDQTALVLFHTGFNLLGTLVFLPLTSRFAAFVEWLVPERRVALAAPLDPRLLPDEGAAMDAAQAVVQAIARAIFAALASALGPARDFRGLSTLGAQVQPALTELEDYLARIRVPPDRKTDLARYSALLHAFDHLSRLLARAGEHNRIATLTADGHLLRPGAALAASLIRDLSADRRERLAALITSRAKRHRRGVLLREHAGLIPVSDLFPLTDAIRWLERVAHHAARVTLYAEKALHK